MREGRIVRYDGGASRSKGDFECQVEGCGNRWYNKYRGAAISHVKRHREGYKAVFVDEEGRPLSEDRPAKISAGIVSIGTKGEWMMMMMIRMMMMMTYDLSLFPRPNTPVSAAQDKKKEASPRRISLCLPYPCHQHR